MNCEAKIPIDGKSWNDGTQKTRFSCEFLEKGKGSERYLLKRVYCLPADRFLLISYNDNKNASELPQPALDPSFRFCTAFYFHVSILLPYSLSMHYQLAYHRIIVYKYMREYTKTRNHSNAVFVGGDSLGGLTARYSTLCCFFSYVTK
jgi:hypothetical protein